MYTMHGTHNIKKGIKFVDSDFCIQSAVFTAITLGFKSRPKLVLVVVGEIRCTDLVLREIR
jgi:hypothetical protein